MSIDKLRSFYFCAFIFLFPLLIGTIQHGASVVFIALVVPGLVLGWPSLKKLEKSERRVLIGFVVLFGISLVGLLWSEDVRQGLKRLERSVRFLLIIPAYLVLRREKVAIAECLIPGLCLGAFCMLGLALYEILTSTKQRAWGPYNPIIFGQTAVWIASQLYVCLMVLDVSRIKRAVFLIASFCALYASILSVTRGALIFIPVMILFPFIWNKATKRHVFTVGLIIVLVVCATALTVYILPKIRYDVRVGSFLKLFSGSYTTEKIPLRLLVWQDSMRIYSGSPLLGVGTGDFELELKKLIQNGDALQENAFDHAHNIYIDALVRHGPIGFLLIITCLHVLPVNSFRELRTVSSNKYKDYFFQSGIMSLLAFAIFGLTEDWLARMPLLTTYVLAFAIQSAGLHSGEHDDLNNTYTVKGD